MRRAVAGWRSTSRLQPWFEFPSEESGEPEPAACGVHLKDRGRSVTLTSYGLSLLRTMGATTLWNIGLTRGDALGSEAQCLHRQSP
jgi:hypothetical protein